jgi:putative membrane protein
MGLRSFGKFLIKCYRATVINDIWHLVILFAGWAAVIQAITKYKHDLGISNQILTVLGTVLGLVISFRTSTAYERYGEGRKLWTSITLHSRTLGTLIWVHVPTDRPLKAGQTEDPNKNRKLEAIVEKKSMINLVQAYSVAIKHMLRGEPGVFWADLYPLISFLPKYAPHASEEDKTSLPVWHHYGMELRKFDPEASRSDSPSGSRRKGAYDPEKALPEAVAEYELGPASSPPPTTVYDVLPFLIIFKPLVRLFSRATRKHDSDNYTLSGKRKKAAHVDSNVPMELSLFLHSYLAFCLKAGLLAPAAATAFTNTLGAMQDAVANLDRVRNTPLPFAYQAHLRMCLWLYLFFLPFQIVKAYGWLTIPATAFASFLMLGFLEIGAEIEDPFGYDMNDLPLDEICLAIQRELHEITAHPAPEPSSYVFSADNQPFAPYDRTPAATLIADRTGPYSSAETGMGSVYGTLLRNWQQVNEYTRK